MSAQAGACAGERAVVCLQGRRLLDGQGLILAELAPDECWYTPEGLPCSGLTLPAPRLYPRVSRADRESAARTADEAWVAGAVETIADLARARPTITSDDVWAGIEMPPRESRMIGNALSRARALGLIEPTEAHRPSTRRQNHSRPVRVWRSLCLAMPSE